MEEHVLFGRFFYPVIRVWKNGEQGLCEHGFSGKLISNEKRRCKVDFHILQHRLFLLYEGLPYPNDRNVETLIAAREAGSQSARKHMLAQSLRAARTISVCCAQHLLRRAYPIAGNVKSAITAHGAVS